MTDISKCSGDGCDRRDRCWRYLAPSSDRQTWMLASACVRSTKLGTDPVEDHFLPVKPTTQPKPQAEE